MCGILLNIHPTIDLLSLSRWQLRVDIIIISDVVADGVTGDETTGAGHTQCYNT